MQGLPEFAVHYSGNVFVFSTEETMKQFVEEPKKYINSRPFLPTVFRTLIIGPQGAGKHEIAEKLNEEYGWKIVDFKKVVREMLGEIMQLEIHIPNNPEGGRIGLSE